jgi:hypothetical protein
MVEALKYFEEAPLHDVDTAIALVKEIGRRRHAGESILTVNGPKVDPPQRKRRLATPPENTATQPGGEG